MRVYLPSSITELGSAMATGGFAPPITAYAVTPALREWYASGDSEELEYAAMIDAARESLRRLHADPSAPARRVVVAADVSDPQTAWAPEVHPAAVRLGAFLPWSSVVAVHVDDPGAEADVKAAAAAVRAADAGDPDASFTVDGVEDHELLWYATQEVPDLVRDLRAS
jgi:uncharacterized protein DUF6912